MMPRTSSARAAAIVKTFRVAPDADDRPAPAPRPTVAGKAALASAVVDAKMRLYGIAAGICPPTDPVAAEFETALALRRSGADPKALRRALRRIEELLDE